MTAPSLTFDKTRASPFAYACNACNRCCYHKAIQVGPYEVLRLARNRGISTTELLLRHTEAGGTTLRVRPDGACVFLTARGCGVHPDRPLVCRLYPLGRIVDAEGRERFADMPPHPETAGVYGADSTVERYILSQGVAPYIAAGDRYAALYGRMIELFARLTAASDAPRVTPEAAGEPPPGVPLSPWLDVDATVAAYCAERGLPVPPDPDVLIDLHIRAVDAWLDDLAARGDRSAGDG